MYDRTKLREAAGERRVDNPNQLATYLGIGRMTAYRLWNGVGEPNRRTEGIVRNKLGLDLGDLLIELEPAA